ncbi:response regulator transcription factor [Planotetraspora sp. A-T 1434]|uniref:response regulator transcription factor n=1 Tax=Planotetraspora sp. A-T 1434 TaxID=2979219 RepID=UPI0021BE584C|nr:response regulator transcription factor [Planotetraspora sp. A-T 1434]MCT9931846.1 response regulator transcription factor [Planotetraspora sp. A-T 1434]
MSEPLRAVLGEDQPIVREGITAMLERSGIEVVASVGNAVELVRAAAEQKPDVVITDIQMPPNLADDGLQAARRIRAEQPGTPVIVLSQFLDASFALDLVGEDPSGVAYLLKEKVASSQVLTDAVQRVIAGGSALDPDVISTLVGRKRKEDPLSGLTPREKEVLALMAEGHSNSGIAEKLVVTVPAVERHVTGIFLKLGLQQAESSQHRRVLAVLHYLKR